MDLTESKKLLDQLIHYYFSRRTVLHGGGYDLYEGGDKLVTHVTHETFCWSIFSAYKHFRTHILHKNLSLTPIIFWNEFLCKYLVFAEDPSVQSCILHHFQFYRFCVSQNNLIHIAGFPFIKYTINDLKDVWITYYKHQNTRQPCLSSLVLRKISVYGDPHFSEDEFGKYPHLIFSQISCIG